VDGLFKRTYWAPLLKVPEVDLGLRTGERDGEKTSRFNFSFKKDPVDMRNEMRLRDCWFVELWDGLFWSGLVF